MNERAVRSRWFWLAGACTAGVLAFALSSRQEAGDALKSELQSVLSAAEAGRGADPAAYLRMLREHLEREPRDARAWVIYARLQVERDQFAEAAQAYERGLALSTKVARDPAVWCEYADALAMARDGKLEGKPRELIDRALALDAKHPKALEMAGSAEYEQGRYGRALDYWRALQAQLTPGSRRYIDLAAAIERTERRASARR